MIIAGSFALLRPYWLVLLPALYLFLKFTKKRNNILGDWPRVIDPPLLDALLARNTDPVSEEGRDWIVWCIILIILSLSGPALRKSLSAQFRNLDAVLLVMNVSDTSALSKTTTAAQIVLSGSGARQTGLVLYAGDAYLACPLTYDLASIESLIFSIDAQTIPDGGSRPDLALEHAHRVLRNMHIYAGDVVLISDGAGIDVRTRQEARSLAAEGHSLHTILISTAEMSDEISSSLRADMSQLAAAGHGLAAETSSAANISEAIQGRGIDRIDRNARNNFEWLDIGRYIVILAVIPLIMFLRRCSL